MADGARHFDISYLNQVFQGNKELIIQIVKLFLKQVPEYVRMMEIHLNEGDYHAIHPLAHKSKSSSSMLGLSTIERLLIDIELTAKSGRYDSLPEKIHMLREQLNLSVSELNDFVKSQNK